MKDRHLARWSGPGPVPQKALPDDCTAASTCKALPSHCTVVHTCKPAGWSIFASQQGNHSRFGLRGLVCHPVKLIVQLVPLLMHGDLALRTRQR